MLTDVDVYRNGLRIDRNALDDELIKQPSAFLEVAQACAVTASRRDQAREEQKRIDAERSMAIRAKAEGKITEAAIAAQLELDQQHIDARNSYLLLCREAEELLALKDAFIQRSYVLKDLCALFIAGYFSNSAERTPAGKAVAEAAYEQDRKAINKRRQRVKLEESK